MSAEVTITWKADEWMAAAMPAIDAGLTAAALVMADQATRNLSENSPPSSPGQFPAHDQSTLRNSIAFASPEALGTPGHAAFGTAIHYGRMLEFGGTIRAKGKKLKVPIDRERARSVERTGKAKDLVLIKRDNKAPILALIKNAGRASRRTSTGHYAGGDQVIPVYVLMQSVTIKPRPWIVRSAHMAKPLATEMFVRVAGEKLKAAGLVKGGAS